MLFFSVCFVHRHRVGEIEIKRTTTCNSTLLRHILPPNFAANFILETVTRSQIYLQEVFIGALNQIEMLWRVAKSRI
jgi:hypothetical protein